MKTNITDFLKKDIAKEGLKVMVKQMYGSEVYVVTGTGVEKLAEKYDNVSVIKRSQVALKNPFGGVR